MLTTCDKRPSVCVCADVCVLGLYGSAAETKLFKRGTFEAAANHVTTRGRASNAHASISRTEISTPSRLTSQQWQQRSIAGYDVCLVTANRGQWASPDEFSITIGGRYVREQNREFSLPNRTIVIRASKSGGFRENREGWQP